MSSLNKVTLIGNLGKDPEIKSMQNGDRIVNMSIATSDRWRDKSTNERREKTEWHRVVVFNDKLAEIIQKYARKGSKVYLEGKLQTRKWTDQKGVERYSTEVVLANFDGKIVLLDGAKSDQAGDDDGQQSHSGNGQTKTSERRTQDQLDDELPF